MSNNSTKSPRSTKAADGSGGVQSVDRAISVLEILARSGGAGVSEVAADIGVHKSTAFRLLGALEARGLVEQNRDRGKYRLGFGVLRLASAIPGRLDLVHQGRPILERAGRRVRRDGQHGGAALPLRRQRRPGARPGGGGAQNWIAQLTPLHATSSGKVLLAHLQPRRATPCSTRPAWPASPTTPSPPEGARSAARDRARGAGYATTFEEYEDGLNAMAVPVRDHTGTVVGALSVSGPAYRLDKSRMQDLLERLKGRRGAARGPDGPPRLTGPTSPDRPHLA